MIIVDGVAGPCPFCRGNFQAGFDPDGEPVATHSLPPCETFASLEIDEYVAAVRRVLGGRDQEN